MTDYLMLKWGTLKGYELESDGAKDALNSYLAAGDRSISVIAQHDSEEQKRLLCAVVDSIRGVIVNDWSGEEMTKDEAKKYILEYKS